MKRNLKLKTLMYPAPAVIAFAYDENGKVDGCTLAFAAMCSHVPPSIMIAINHSLKRKTLVDILENKEFTLAFPSAEQVAEADYFGLASGYDTNKLEDIGFTYQDAEMVNAPIVNEFKVSLECKVSNVTSVGSHDQIIAEIVNIQADEDILDEKDNIILEKLNPIAYDIFNREYYSLGEKVGDSYKIGLKFKK
mgnify:CR=1 FL=1